MNTKPRSLLNITAISLLINYVIKLLSFLNERAQKGLAVKKVEKDLLIRWEDR